MTYFHYLKDDDERENLRAWWRSLNERRGDRARLRRAETPDDILLSNSFFNFLKTMPDEWSNQLRLQSSAIVAATLAHVKENISSQSLAEQMASPKERGGKKPTVSELRFEQLQKSRSPEEFFTRLRRIVHLLDGRVNLLSLSDSILHWMKEHHRGVNKEPLKRLAVVWATDYYKNLPKS